MGEYKPVDLGQTDVEDLIITGSSPEDQANFEDLLEVLSTDRADRIAYPKPFSAVADNTLVPAAQKLKELHGFRRVHILDTVGGGEHMETAEYARLRKMANEVIGDALGGVAVFEYVLETEDEEGADVNDLAITCSDHRFQDGFNTMVASRLGGRVARIIHPGPSLSIANRQLLSPVGAIDSRYGIKRLGIFDHTDCGGGGGLAAHGGDARIEALVHHRNSQRAGTVLAEEFPGMRVTTHVVGVNGEIPPPRN